MAESSKPPGPISEKLFNALRQVETGGATNPKTVEGSRDGCSYGPYQIREQYWKDACEEDPSLLEGGKTWKSCLGEGSFLYSERVMQAYMKKYATKERLYRKPTNEDIARIHKGGPNGHKSTLTARYWVLVQEQLK